MLELRQLGQVGVDDRREGDLVQVDLLAQDQVQQQIERPVEDRRLDRVGHPDTIEPRDGAVPAHSALAFAPMPTSPWWTPARRHPPCSWPRLLRDRGGL